MPSEEKENEWRRNWWSRLPEEIKKQFMEAVFKAADEAISQKLTKTTEIAECPRCRKQTLVKIRTVVTGSGSDCCESCGCQEIILT